MHFNKWVLVCFDPKFDEHLRVQLTKNSNIRPFNCAALNRPAQNYDRNQWWSTHIYVTQPRCFKQHVFLYWSCYSGSFRCKYIHWAQWPHPLYQHGRFSWGTSVYMYQSIRPCGYPHRHRASVPVWGFRPLRLCVHPRGEDWLSDDNDMTIFEVQMYGDPHVETRT